MTMTAPRTMAEAKAMREQHEREDFHLRVTGQHPDQTSYRRYVIGHLRIAYRRLRCHMQAIKEAAAMIEEGVDPAEALAEIGSAMAYVIPQKPEEPDGESV